MSTAVNTAAPHGSIGTTRLRLTRRGRIVFSTMAALPLVVGAFVVTINGGAAVASNSDQGTAAFHYVTVSAGQSLWQVAETIAPEADPRDVIAEIVALNQLSSATVEPGQRLALPLTD